VKTLSNATTSSIPVNSTCRGVMRDTDRSLSTGSVGSRSGTVAVNLSFSVRTLKYLGERAQVAMKVANSVRRHCCRARLPMGLMPTR
jgi:hypothetical protein